MNPTTPRFVRLFLTASVLDKKREYHYPYLCIEEEEVVLESRGLYAFLSASGRPCTDANLTRCKREGIPLQASAEIMM